MVTRLLCIDKETGYSSRRLLVSYFIDTCFNFLDANIGNVIAEALNVRNKQNVKLMHLNHNANMFVGTYSAVIGAHCKSIHLLPASPPMFMRRKGE